jgi:hypothetical protein
MPDGGKFVTEAGYQVALVDGTIVTGQRILDDVRQWLANGFPEEPPEYAPTNAGATKGGCQ